MREHDTFFESVPGLIPSSGHPSTPAEEIRRHPGSAVVDLAAGTVTASAEVACRPERLYRMLVTAEMERWWGSPDSYAMQEWTAELRPQGSWRVQVCFADGRRVPASGKFLEFDPPERIVETRAYEFDHASLGRRETRVSYLIEPRDSGARLTVFHEGFAGLEEAAIEHASGWERVLGWLVTYARRVSDEERRWQ